MPRGGGGARLRSWPHRSHWVLSSSGWLYPVPFIRHFYPLGFQCHCLCRGITEPWHARNCWMLGFLPKGIVIPAQETSDVLDPGGPLQVDGPTMATFFETNKKKKVVCIQTMLKTSTWLWSLTRTPNPGPVIPADSLSPLPLIALWYEHRHALLMRCLHHSSLMTSDKRPFPHRCHPWSFGGPFLVLEDYEISQSRNNSNNNNNSDIVSI